MNHAIFTLIAGILAVFVSAVILTFICFLAERELIPSRLLGAMPFVACALLRAKMLRAAFGG